jgi:Uncharacterized membrane protein (homolog of Drosophila rhomboid)
MSLYGDTEDHQPVTWIRGYPLYAAHIVVAVLTASMLVTTIVLATRATGFQTWMMFTSDGVLRGEIWRLATYGLLNQPSLGFVIDMVMLVWFGREVERYLGRRPFLQLYVSLYFVTPLVLTVIGLGRPTLFAGQTGSLAIFVAFATLYPDAMLLFNLLAKWVAIVLVGIFTLMALAANDLTRLLTLWSTTGFAYAYIRYSQGRFSLPSFKLPSRGPKLRVLPDPKPSKPKPAAAAKTSRENPMAEIDALLDKIATSGIDSLTPKERAKLESARAALKRRDSE